jgi:PIN domain nuclease of toxin-antitoxin system
MSLLLDSCALIALSNGSLPAAAAAALRTGIRAYTCSVSVWEIAIKWNSRKLHLAAGPADWFTALSERYRIEEIALHYHAACAAAALPVLHNDPFDRVIIATALERNLQILTSDRTIPTYPGIATLW